MKTIGILGGIGPQATIDFQARVHREAQKLIPQDRNYGYPPMVVSYFRALPMVLGPDGAPGLPLRAHPDLLEAARRLGSLADFIVITSNFTHAFAPDIETAAGRPVLSMIEITLDEVRRRGWRHVGVLGFGDPVIYTQPLRAEGRDCETIEPPHCGRISTGRSSVSWRDGRTGRRWPAPMRLSAPCADAGSTASCSAARRSRCCCACRSCHPISSIRPRSWRRQRSAAPWSHSARPSDSGIRASRTRTIPTPGSVSGEGRKLHVRKDLSDPRTVVRHLIGREWCRRFPWTSPAQHPS